MSEAAAATGQVGQAALGLAAASKTADHIQRSLPSAVKHPKIAIICGSGLGGLSKAVSEASKIEIAYRDIPNFPVSSVVGHASKLLFGTIGKTETPVVLMVGRVHYYEGHSLQQVTFSVRVLHCLGVETIFGLNQSFSVGDLMIINDHINLAGLAGSNPLIGPNDDALGPRFPPLSDAYDLTLRKTAHSVWLKLKHDREKRRLHEGVYAFVAGPNYETRAECRMLHAMGADVVGMSTVPEVIVARHAGMRVLAFSLVTNKSILDPVPRGDDSAITDASRADMENMMGAGKANHAEVLQEGHDAAADLESLIVSLIDDVAPA